MGTKGAVSSQNTLVPSTDRDPTTSSSSSSHSSPSVDHRVKTKDESSSTTNTPKSSSGVKTVVAPPKDLTEKENVNIIFIGHVDAGKSTIGGHIM